MADDARSQLRLRMSRLAERAIARIHENRPDLRGKSPEETVATIREEERHTSAHAPNTGFIMRGMSRE